MSLKNRGSKQKLSSLADSELQDSPDPSTLVELPIGLQQLENYVKQYRSVDLFGLRRETMRHITK
jgi:hypothetical protein